MPEKLRTLNTNTYTEIHLKQVITLTSKKLSM